MKIEISSDLLSSQIFSVPSGQFKDFNKFNYSETTDNFIFSFLGSPISGYLPKNVDSINNIYTISLKKTLPENNSVSAFNPYFNNIFDDTYHVIMEVIFDENNITSTFTSSEIIVSESSKQWEYFNPLPKAVQNVVIDDTNKPHFVYYKEISAPMNWNQLTANYPQYSNPITISANIRNIGVVNNELLIDLTLLSGNNKLVDRDIYISSGNYLVEQDKILSPEKQILDFSQYGTDYIFQLTKHTFNRNTTINNTTSSDLSGNYQISAETLKNSIYNYDIVTYYPEDHYKNYPELSSDMQYMVNNHIDNLNFSFERNKILFGYYDNYLGEVVVFSKGKSLSSVDSKWIWPTSGLVYQYVEGIPVNYFVEYYTGSSASSGKYLTDYNFKLKNEYDYEYNLQTDKQRLLSGNRDYLGINIIRDNIYLKYKYKKDWDYKNIAHSENLTDRYKKYSPEDEYNLNREKFIKDKRMDFEFIEVMNGFYKFSAFNKHKTNIFSIELENSKIDEINTPFNLKDNDGNVIVNLDSNEVKTKLKELITNELKKIINKIKPSNTIFWKIKWK